MEPKRKYGSIEKIWTNETVYIIGGGPSLKGFDWNRLKGKKVIAINRAYEVMPNADALYWTDSRFYRWFKNDINNLNTLKVTCRPFNGIPNDVVLLKANSAMILDMRPDSISHGNNSGYGAINLAAKLGAKKIYLLGYDMNSEGNNTHWHSGYESRHNHSIYNKMMRYFESLPAELKKHGIEVYNANPQSKLDVFPKCTIDEAISA